MRKVYLGIAIFIGLVIWRAFHPVEPSINRAEAVGNVAGEVARDAVCTESQWIENPGMCGRLAEEKKREYEKRLEYLHK